jgi:hypothetical protein
MQLQLLHICTEYKLATFSGHLLLFYFCYIMNPSFYCFTDAQQKSATQEVPTWGQAYLLNPCPFWCRQRLLATEMTIEMCRIR